MIKVEFSQTDNAVGIFHVKNLEVTILELDMNETLCLRNKLDKLDLTEAECR